MTFQKIPQFCFAVNKDSDLAVHLL